MTEESFWSATLRKINSLIREHNRQGGLSPQEETLTGSSAINALMGSFGSF